MPAHPLHPIPENLDGKLSLKLAIVTPAKDELAIKRSMRKSSLDKLPPWKVLSRSGVPNNQSQKLFERFMDLLLASQLVLACQITSQFNKKLACFQTKTV